MTESPRAQAAFLARLRHILDAISSLHRGNTGSVSRFSGNESRGQYAFSNGGGDHAVLMWDERGLVALEFDHGSADSEFGSPLSERTPERLFKRAPQSLAALVSDVCAWGERLGTHAVWIDVAEKRGRSPTNGKLLSPFLGTVDAALHGAREGEGWIAAALSRAHGETALALALASRHGTHVVDAAEEEALLSTPTGRSHSVTTKNVTAVVTMLADAGVEWRGAVEAAARAGERVQRARQESDTDRGFALLEAVDRSDVQGVQDLLREGANIEKRSEPGQFKGAAGCSETPLLLAARTGHVELVKILLDHGADANARTGGYSPLTRAIRRGRVEMCRLLVEHGADPTFSPDGSPGDLLVVAGERQDLEVIRFLLDAGCPLPAPAHRKGLALLAEEQKDAELAARLLGGDEG